jgi:hypothetical protein
MQNNNFESIVHCKVLYNNEFRRFPLTKGFSLVDLISKIKTLLNLDTDFTIKYKDEEDDWITISSDVELETGLSLCNNNLFRLSVNVANVPTATPNPENPSDASCNNDDLYVPVHRRCKGRKKRWENDEQEDQKDQNENDECGGYRKCGRGRRGGRRGGKWRGRGRYHRSNENNENEDGNSSGSEEDNFLKLSLTEINNEITSLTEENTLLSEKMSNLKDEIASFKGQIRAKRQDDNATKEEIGALRSELQDKKRSIRPLFAQIKSNRFRLRKLGNLASTKSE